MLKYFKQFSYIQELYSTVIKSDVSRTPALAGNRQVETPAMISH